MSLKLRSDSLAARATGIAIIALLFVGNLSSQTPVAQRITIRMLDGKTGRPFGGQNVTFHFSPHYSDEVVHMDKNGVGTIDIPPGAELFSLMGGPKIGKEPERIPFSDCNASNIPEMTIVQVLRSGYDLGNSCSKKKAVARPGEILFWARPIRWWQADMQ